MEAISSTKSKFLFFTALESIMYSPFGGITVNSTYDEINIHDQYDGAMTKANV
jgi:hypothetical protein